jgi:hypothetical protein
MVYIQSQQRGDNVYRQGAEARLRRLNRRSAHTRFPILEVLELHSPPLSQAYLQQLQSQAGPVPTQNRDLKLASARPSSVSLVNTTRIGR